MKTGDEQRRELEKLKTLLQFVALPPGTLAASMRDEFVQSVDDHMAAWAKNPDGVVLAVHHLHHGIAPCAGEKPEMRGLPRDWPPGHLWSGDWGDVTCASCLVHAPKA